MADIDERLGRLEDRVDELEGEVRLHRLVLARVLRQARDNADLRALLMKSLAALNERESWGDPKTDEAIETAGEMALDKLLEATTAAE